MADMTAAEVQAIRASLATTGGPVVDELMEDLRAKATRAAASNQATASISVPNESLARFLARIAAAGYTVDRQTPNGAKTAVIVRWGPEPN